MLSPLDTEVLFYEDKLHSQIPAISINTIKKLMLTFKKQPSKD